MQFKQLGLDGYGEVGKIFSAGLKPQVETVSAWDLKLAQGHPLQVAELAHAAQAGVQACSSLQALCAQADCIISAVTASNTLAVAREAAQHIRPGTKQQAAAMIDGAGGHYVEAGVMTSVPPYGIRVPMLLGGAQAQVLAATLGALGMDAKAVAAEIGVASAIKMCRSVMIKGLEALVIESYTTARHYGVEGHMIPTLAETFPSIDWEQTGSGVFDGITKNAPWQDYADRLIANTPPPPKP